MLDNFVVLLRGKKWQVHRLPFEKGKGMNITKTKSQKGFWRKNLRMLGAVVCGAALLFLAGCEDEGSKNWKFTNNSSYRVYVVPNGQSWSPATVSPGSSVTVDWNQKIQYVYTPSNRVYPTSADGNVIIFYNR